MVDLAKLNQKIGETMEQYIGRFKKAGNQCSLGLPEMEYVWIA